MNHNLEYEQNSCPLITVVMSVYNDEDTVGQAISSILNQSWQNIEFIICDDASTDGTWKRLEKWGAEDDRIRLLRNDRNLGAGASRNRCFACANGQFIALMDADDISLPSRLSVEMDALLSQTDIAFVGTKGAFFGEEEDAPGRYYWFLAAPGKEDFLMTLPFVHASLMFRREVLEALGGYDERPWLRRAEDYDLLMRAYALGYRGINLLEPLYSIRADSPYQRERYRWRICGCAVKWRGFTRLGLMPRGVPYALKPLLVGLIPTRLLMKMKKRYYAGWETRNGI